MSRPQLNLEIKELAKSVPVPSYTYQISKKADLERIRNRAQRIYNDLIATGRKQSLKGFSKSQIANLVKDKQDALGIRARKAVQSTSDSFNQLAKIQAARNRRANKPEKMFEPDYDIVSAMEKLTLTPVSISFEKVSESSARIADSIESKYRLQISPDNSQIDLPTTLKIINNLVLLHTNERQLQQNDRIAISVQNPKTGYWASTGLRTVAFASTDEFVQLFFEKISSIIEYDGSLSLEDLVFTVRSNRTVNGGTRQNRVVNPEEDLHSKKSVFKIKNTDNLCLARCITIAINKDHPKIKQIKMGRPIQTELAEQLQTNVGITNDLCTLEDVLRFQDYLQRNIIVINNSNSVVFANIKYVREQDIYVYYHNNHFDLITKIHAFIGMYHWCQDCLKGYNNKHVNCSTKASKSIEWVHCNDCNRNLNKLDFEKHACDRLKKCIDCNRLYDVKKLERSALSHICDHDFCKNCGQYSNIKEHQCFIQKSKLKPKIDNVIYLDFEAMQETGTHIVNLAVIYKSKYTEYDYQNCKLEERNGKKYAVFYCLDSFCKYIFSKRHQNHTIVAHNGKGYDFQFIRKWLIDNGLTPYVINSGSKITFMELNEYKIRFVDSLNFLLMALREFPKTFGLTELKKGYFPHYFNKACHQKYVGRIPAKHHYGYNYMSTETKENFDEWYSENKNTRLGNEVAYVEFDMQRDILEYCISDVELLASGYERLREIFLETCNCDPLNYITIASCCMDIYRANHMSENSIAIFKQILDDTHSKASIEYLEYIQKSEGIYIIHALNGKEHKVGKYRVDGYCEATKTVYEFNGCMFHGCQKCFNPFSTNAFGEKYIDLFNDTNRRKAYIQSKGYKVVEMWECEWKRLRRTPAVMDFVKTNEFEARLHRAEKLNMRDAFFGGRTNALKLHYKVKGNEKIYYVDFTSLYPYINFVAKYPYGNFTRIQNPNKSDLQNSFGFAKVKILAPHGLYIPVLPCKSDKLIFGLCRTCIKNQESMNKETRKRKRSGPSIQSHQECEHSDEERALIGTWCTPEIEKAISLGYQIQEVYDIFHFEQTSTELFKSYVSLFLKIKQEASDIPKWVKTDEEKQKYVDDYFNNQGVKLDIANVNGENKGLRCMAKLCLNSLWGKFGQRSNFKQLKYISSDLEFYALINNDKVNEVDWKILNDDVLECTFDLRDDCIKESTNTNIAIASFTTCWARLKLYSVLEQLQGQVLYFDTDSIIYVFDETNPDHVKLQTGDYLGDLTDELKGDYIVEFVSTGPKSYAYVTSKGKTVCKVKGFSLNDTNKKLINFETMKDIVYGKRKDIVLVNENKITRSNMDIVNKYEEKVFKFVYDKRIIQEDKISTLPIGY